VNKEIRNSGTEIHASLLSLFDFKFVLPPPAFLIKVTVAKTSFISISKRKVRDEVGGWGNIARMGMSIA